MIAQVIPLKKIPRHLTFFDYHIPKELQGKVKQGCLVKIPWRNQVIFGLVKKIVIKPTKKNLKLKEVIAVLYPQPLVSPVQEKLISQLTDKFYLASSLWWKMILPQIPAKKSSFKPWLSSDKLGRSTPLKFRKATLPQSPPKLGRKIKGGYGSIKSNNKLQLIIPDNFNDLIAITIKLIKSKGFNLLLCPEINHLELILSYLPESYVKKIAVFHKRQSKTEYWQNYLKVADEKAKLIIGTRLAVLAPFRKLDSITVFKSEDYSFKQADQNPRFWIHEAVYALQVITSAQLYFLSLAPRISNFAYIKKQRGQILNKQKPLNIKIADMAKELQINNYSHISWQLERSITETLAKKKQVFLLVNRKGLAKRVVCKDCGWVATCDICSKLLSVTAKNLTYCDVCSKQKQLPIKCPKCQGVNLMSQGITNQYILGQIKKIYPQIKSEYVDVDNPKLNKTTKIIVGTQFAINKLSKLKLGLVAFITADQDITSLDYHGSEHAWQLFSNVARLINKLTVVLQTFQPDYYLYKYFSQAKWDKFWQTEMNFRKKYSYPPYTKFLRCMVSDKYEQRAMAKITTLYSDLKSKLPESVSLIQPLPVAARKINNKYVFFVLLKYKQEDLGAHLASLPADIILDFDPYSVF